MRMCINNVKIYMCLMRVKHYIKNLLIFVPLLFSGKMLDIQLLVKGILAFLIFSFTSSIVYIVNDIRDAEKDRLHSTKRNRPIASGEVSVKAAVAVAIVLGIACVVTMCFVSRVSIYIILIPITYLFINILYSMGMKNIPIVDIAMLTAGFILRILMGSFATGIYISGWLYLTVFSGSFYMAFCKRRNEIDNEGAESRSVLMKYTYSFLDKNMYMCINLAIVFYSLWCIDADTIHRIGTDKLSWSIPLVIVTLLKYNFDVEGNSDGDPVEVIMKDKFLMVLGTVYTSMMFFIIYF